MKENEKKEYELAIAKKVKEFESCEKDGHTKPRWFLWRVRCDVRYLFRKWSYIPGVLYRRVTYAWFNYKVKMVARFIINHRLWWNCEDEVRWKRV